MKFTYPPMATRPWFKKTASEAKRQTSRVHMQTIPFAEICSGQCSMFTTAFRSTRWKQN